MSRRTKASEHDGPMTSVTLSLSVALKQELERRAKQRGINWQVLVRAFLIAALVHDDAGHAS